MATVIYPIQRNWHAPDEWINRLARSLPDEYVVNAGGEVISSLPSDISQFVSNGGTWIDYCGHPMYYLDGRWFAEPWFAQGFRDFLMFSKVLFPFSFMPRGFTYPRSLEYTGKGVVPEFIKYNPRTPHTDTIFSCFRMDIGQGRYFYAYAREDGTGVNPDEYIRFILEVSRREEIPQIPVSSPILTTPMLIGGGLLVGGLVYAKTRARRRG